MSANKHTGTCFCGAVEIEVTDKPLEMGYCHCNSCRAYTGAPMSAFILWTSDQVRVTKGAEFVGSFNKMGMSDRQFCRKCGGHLMSYHPSMDATDVHAGIIPGVAFTPVVHLNYAEAVLPIKDGIPKLRDFPAHAGGSGEVLAE